MPELTEHTRCGWCRHDLRGISRPVCPECGHTIGDRGPDEQHEMPPGFRARRGMPFLVPAFFPVAIVFFSFPVGILVYLLVPGSHGSLRGSVLELAVLLLSLAATLTFYEAFLQFILAHSGRCWCSACGVELRDLREPVCPACGQRI